MSSSATLKLNLPVSISLSMVRKPLVICIASLREMSFTFASMLACAIEPRMSWRKSRRSNGSDAVNASTSGRRPAANRPRRILPAAVFPVFPRAAIRRKISFDEVNRVAEVDVAIALDGSEGAEVSLVPMDRGAQDRKIARQVLLRVRRHYAAERRRNRDDLDAIADFEHAADPFVLDEAVRIATGIDQQVGAETAIVEIRITLGEVAHMRERSSCD